jgi:hypothetical protein
MNPVKQLKDWISQNLENTNKILLFWASGTNHFNQTLEIYKLVNN